MTRRALLAMLAGAAALDPEQLIWRPGRKLISIAAAPKATYFSLDFSPRHQPRDDISAVRIVDQYGRTIAVHSFPLGQRVTTRRDYHWAFNSIPPSRTFPEGLMLWPAQDRLRKLYGI